MMEGSLAGLEQNRDLHDASKVMGKCKRYKMLC